MLRRFSIYRIPHEVVGLVHEKIKSFVTTTGSAVREIKGTVVLAH